MDQLDLNLLTSKSNLYLLSPYLKEEKKRDILKVWDELDLEDHVFICSSGTTSYSNIKTYLLSKQSLRFNAMAVNNFLGANERDHWLISLPFYHVGGLSIYFRSLLCGSKVFSASSKWSPQNFMEALTRYGVSYTSLVPTQLYDLVKEKRSGPEGLKGLFIGGDFLSEALAREALRLGWPIIVTYGMTETCSQLASSFYQDLKDGHIRVFPEHSITLSAEKADVYSGSLFTGCLTIRCDGKVEKLWRKGSHFTLPDEVSLLEEAGEQWVRPLGRQGQELKIKGKLVDLGAVRNTFEALCLEKNIWGEAALQIIPCQRNGHRLLLRFGQKAWRCEKFVREGIIHAYPYLSNLIEVKQVDKLIKSELGKFKLA